MGFARTSHGEEQAAADYFRSGIELSLNLPKGSDDQPHSDALNISAMYNKLGLALRDAGVTPVLAKETFAEGLLLAPGDFALLVNGGAAYQVLVWGVSAAKSRT